MPAQRGGGICEIMGDGCIKFCRARRGGFARLGVSTLPLALHAGMPLALALPFQLALPAPATHPGRRKQGDKQPQGDFSRFPDLNVRIEGACQPNSTHSGALITCTRRALALCDRQPCACSQDLSRLEEAPRAPPRADGTLQAESAMSSKARAHPLPRCARHPDELQAHAARLRVLTERPRVPAPPRRGWACRPRSRSSSWRCSRNRTC